MGLSSLQWRIFDQMTELAINANALFQIDCTEMLVLLLKQY